MSVHLNDLSKVYLQQVAESSGAGEDQEHKYKKSGKKSKDYDGDGEVEDESDEYAGVKDRAIKKATGKVCKECGKKKCECDDVKEAVHATAKQMHFPHEVPGTNLKALVSKAVKRIDTDVDGDTDHNDKAKGELGEFVPGVGNKRLYSSTKTKTAKESFSNWRQDLREVIDTEKSEKPVKEKKVNNKVIVNPEIKEQIQIIEFVELSEEDVNEILNCAKEEVDTRRAPKELLDRLNARREGHMAQDGPNKPAYDAKQRTLKKSQEKRNKKKVEEAVADHLGEGSYEINPAAHRKLQRIEKATKLQQGTKGAESQAAGSAVKRLGGSGINLPLANSYEPKGNSVDEVRNAYAVGMARAQEITGDTPPLKKSTIKKAHKIAKAINKEGFENNRQIDEIAPLAIGAGVAAAAAAPYLLKKFAKPAVDKAIDKPATGSGGLTDKMKQRRDAINQMNSYEPKGEVQSEGLFDGSITRTPSKIQSPKSSPIKRTPSKIQYGPKINQISGPKINQIDERRREEKGLKRSPEPSAAFKAVSKIMKQQQGGRGVKKKPGKKPPTAGQYGAPPSPAQKVAKRRADAKRSQDNMSSRFD